MRDYIEIGTTPCNESCCQVGRDNYSKYGLLEAREFKRMLKSIYADKLDLVTFSIKTFPHDFGSYYDVVVYYDNDEGMNEAYEIEDSYPTDWIEGYGPGYGHLEWNDEVKASEYAECCGHKVPNF